MKAIFAVSALAAAISAQAIAADTTHETTYTGGVEVDYAMQFSRDENTDPTPASSFGIDGDNTSLSASVAVANGPFSGTISFSDGDEVEVSDLMVDNGTFAFGDIGGIVTTEKSVDGMGDGSTWATDAAFRYTNADLGLQVQIESGVTKVKGDFDYNGNTVIDLNEYKDCYGETVTATTYSEGGCDTIKEWDQTLDSLSSAGFAAAYTRDLGVATVTADAQFRMTDARAHGDLTATGNMNLTPYYGVKVVAAPVEMLSITAGYTSGNGADLSDASLSDSSYGVRADMTVMEGVTAYASYADNEGATKTQAGAAAAFGPATVSADHIVDSKTVLSAAVSQAVDAATLAASIKYTMPATGDATFEANANVAYVISEATSAAAGVTSFNGDNLEVTASVTHTLEDGIVMTAAYENDDRTGGTDKDGDKHNKHELKLTASYSF